MKQAPHSQLQLLPN